MLSNRFRSVFFCAALWLTCSGAAAQSLAEAEEVAEGVELVTVGSPFVNIYSGPGRGYPIFHVAEYGEQLWLLKRRTDWVKVAAHRNKTGWVRIADLHEIYGTDGELVRVLRPDFRGAESRQLHLGFSYGDLDGSSSMGATLGYRFTAHLSAELRLTQAVDDYSSTDSIQVAVLHQPFPRWQLSPYFMLGTGIDRATTEGPEGGRDTAILTGAGVRTYLTRRLALRLEYANHYPLSSGENNQEIVEWKLGFDVCL